MNEGSKLSFDFSQSIKKKLSNFKLNADYYNFFQLDNLNYIKKKGDVANINFDLVKNKNSIMLNQINFRDGNNLLSLNGAEFSNGKLLKFDQFLVKTFKDNIKNNDFSIIFEKKILVKGDKFDGSNIKKIFNKKNEKNIFSEISKKIEIDLDNIIVPVSEKLKF